MHKRKQHEEDSTDVIESGELFDCSGIEGSGKVSASFGMAKTDCAPELNDVIEAEYASIDFDDRIFGRGEQNLDGRPDMESSSNIESTGVAGRAKQFIPFAALRGFTEMVKEVSRSHDNINQYRNDQGDIS